jgi:hypothetical protein|tara:strand:- start:19 stop:522 length:504 start_codon:yes stop_codon:yes gene_type:complete
MKNFFKYSLYVLAYLALIFILAIMFIATSSESKAELIKPNNSINPQKVVEIQLKGLMNNNYPIKDHGIRQTWEFAHPNNQKNTGPLERFTNMIKGNSYKMLLNHLDHKIVEKQINNSIASYEVIVLDANKTYYKFYWQVERYNKDGFLKDCWLTTLVSAPMSLGSSI